MVMTPSTMVALGSAAPDFHLPDVDGRMVARDDFKDAPALLVMVICNHCPFVQHLREGLARFGHDYRTRGLAMVAINANDVTTHPDDSPAKMRLEAARAGYTFPYLHDESQEIAKAYGAACTPDFFLFDRERRLVYRGQFDGSRPSNTVPVTGADLRAAADTVLAGGVPSTEQRPSIGCNIKWKAGNAPTYA
jgi:peroxiredoxin